MRFISFKFLNPPVIAPVEYSYQADGENAVGDVVRVRCEEYPVPDLADAVKRLSLPVMSKMFGPDVAAAGHPFHFALYGLELRQAGDRKEWAEEVAFNLLLGLPGHEIKTKTPFFGLFDTYDGNVPRTRENEHPDVLGQDLTYGVRQLVDRCMAYMNGERAQIAIDFGVPAKEQALPGLDDATAMNEG